jgi:aspartate kinase
VTHAPVVIKLGGDALASPERIAAQAGRLARRALRERVVAVASARRGMTDHLLGLVAGVQRAVGAVIGPHLEADRAVAAGEVVSAALLALALEQLGCRAASLDAREAGLTSDGQPGDARLAQVDSSPIRRLLDAGVLPVVTGFQGWHEGRVTTLGRGGSDTSAIALAAALGAGRCELVKEAGGLFSADPRVVPDAHPIRTTSHRFLSELTALGAKVVQADAAALAERCNLTLHLLPLDRDEPATVVTGTASGLGSRAVTSRIRDPETAVVTALAGGPLPGALWSSLPPALERAGIAVHRTEIAERSASLFVARSAAEVAVRMVHERFLAALEPERSFAATA